MLIEKWLHGSIVSCVLTILCLPQPMVAQPNLASATFYGGPGDQYGYGLMVQSGAVYIGTSTAQVVRYSIPPGAPTASAAFGGFVNGLTAVGGVIYGVGGAIPPNCGAVDHVGSVEGKTLLARYDFTSLNLLSCQSHNFFPYSGSESYASVVYSSPFIYAAGTGETCGFGNNSLLLSQFDLSGNLLNTVGEPGVNFGGFSCIGNSNGLRMTLFNSNLYVAAFSKLSSEDGVNRPVLMKYGLDLTRQWKVRPTDNQGGAFFGVRGFGGAIYAVGNAVVGGTRDFLIEKYDEAGNRIWSKTSGGSGDDLLYDVVGIGSHIYAVGSTTSQGAGGQDMVILEIDPATGNTISTTLYGGANDDVAYSAATDGTDLYVVGWSNSFATPAGNQVGQIDAVLLRYTTVGPPSLTKSFGAASIPLNGTTPLTFTITNSATNTVSLVGVGFTDMLPTGLTVTSATSSVCGGTLTLTAPTSIVLSGATVAVGTPCQFNVSVTGTAAGAYTNTTGAVTSTNGGTGNTATANLTVVAPPVISKSYSGATVAINSTTVLTITINNPNTTVALTGVGFTDPLPAGLVVVSPGVVGICGGTETTTTSSITLAGATIAAGGTCSFNMSVRGIVAGTQTNITGNVSSLNGGVGNSATASIIVVLPPVISKTFGTLLSIPVGGIDTLSFTITNPNVLVVLTGVAFNDPLPSGLVVANPNGVAGSCGGGTITAIPGSSTITLANGTLAVSGSCTFSVNILGTNESIKSNVTSQVNSIEGGLGNSAAASIVVGTAFQIHYMSYLNAGDSFVDLTNGGFNGGGDPSGDVCANVYVFAPDQQLIECCTCPLTPNHLMTLSGQNDLINNTLTPGVANGITVGLIVTANPTGNAAACDASAVTAASLTAGLRAYGTTLHALPGGSYGVTETPFSPAALNASELMKLDQFCGFIKANGSGHGICGACRPGAQGAKRQ